MNAKLVECALLSPIQHVPIVFKIPPVTPRLRKSNVEIKNPCLTEVSHAHLMMPIT